MNLTIFFKSCARSLNQPAPQSFGSTVKGLKFLKVKSDLTALVDEFASRFYNELGQGAGGGGQTGEVRRCGPWDCCKGRVLARRRSTVSGKRGQCSQITF